MRGVFLALSLLGFEPEAEDGIRFFDFLTGMEMKATLSEDALRLQWLIGAELLTKQL